MASGLDLTAHKLGALAESEAPDELRAFLSEVIPEYQGNKAPAA